MADPRFYPEAKPIRSLQSPKLPAVKKAWMLQPMARHIATAAEADEGAICFITTEAAAQSVPDVKGVICWCSLIWPALPASLRWC